MKELSIINNNDVREELIKFGDERKLTEDEVICSIVYQFAKKLPYSMDYMDEDFVPGIFLNLSPLEPKKWIYKDYPSLYEKMINWSDTKQSGILLQVCNIFQAMLMGQFPDNYQLSEEDFHNLGISQMTSDEEYNRSLFNFLQKLPRCCEIVKNVSDKEERRALIDGIYAIISDGIGQKVGGIRKEIIVDGDIADIKEHKASIFCAPHRDLEMLFTFQGIKMTSDVGRLTKDINPKFISSINLNFGNKELESGNDINASKK